MAKKIKVIHLPTTVGGNPQGLSKHLNQAGLQSVTWTNKQNTFAYDSDYIIQKSSNLFLLNEINKILALRYIFTFNVIFFNFGSTLFQPFIINKKKLKQKKLFYLLALLYKKYVEIMQSVELFLLKKLNKTLLIQYQGDDARQGDYLRKHYKINLANVVDSNYYSKESDKLKRKQIELLCNSCHKVYALNPDLLHVLPKNAEFLPYSHICLYEWRPHYTQLDDRPLRILHAPSNRRVKGTKFILNAVANLKKTGYEFDFSLIEKLSQHDAKEMYKQADIIIDQLFAGWYGGLAVESMALGKPVLAYIRREDLIFLPKKMQNDIPIIQVTSDTIQQTLARILRMPRQEILSLAVKSRKYVEKWHNPKKIAARVKLDILKTLKSN